MKDETRLICHLYSSLNCYMVLADIKLGVTYRHLLIQNGFCYVGSTY